MSSPADLKQRYLEKLKGKKSSVKSPTTTAAGNSPGPGKAPVLAHKAEQKKSGGGQKSSKDGGKERQHEQPASKRKADAGSVEAQSIKKQKKDTDQNVQRQSGGVKSEENNRTHSRSDKKVKGAPVSGAENGRPDAETGKKRKKHETDSPKSLSGTQHTQKEKRDETATSEALEKPLFPGKKKHKAGEEKSEVCKSGKGESKKSRDGVDVSGDKKPTGDKLQPKPTSPLREAFAKAVAAREAAEGAGGGGKGKGKGKERKSVGGESERGEEQGGGGEGEGLFPFEVDPADHAETPAEAYQDIAPVLALLAEAMGKTAATLKVYDPYFCDGGVTRRLRRHGFTQVYNRREDFYKVIANGKVPPHDVVLTNPPYSADHMDKILTFVCGSGKPWLLLVPNFVYTKDYYERTALAMAAGGKTGMKPPMYLVPNKRYTYWTPPWLHQTKFGESTSPFPSFWFLQFGKYADAVAEKFLKLPPKQRAKVTLARGIEELPNEVRAAFDPNKKRKSSKARKRMAKQKMEKRVQAH